jgi:hypothetical protein
MTDGEKDVEILALRHQLTVLQRQLGNQRPRLRPEDRAFLAVFGTHKVVVPERTGSCGCGPAQAFCTQVASPCRSSFTCAQVL